MPVESARPTIFAVGSNIISVHPNGDIYIGYLKLGAIGGPTLVWDKLKQEVNGEDPGLPQV